METLLCKRSSVPQQVLKLTESLFMEQKPRQNTAAVSEKLSEPLIQQLVAAASAAVSEKLSEPLIQQLQQQLQQQ